MSDTTKLKKVFVNASGELVAGGPVRKVYSTDCGNYINCTPREIKILERNNLICQPATRRFVDIILIKYGQPELEKQCIDSIRKHTDLNKHVLTDVDNKKIDKNLGAIWNDLIEASEAPFVLLLNTDTIITGDGWLDELLDVACITRADAVGPMTDKCGINYQVCEKPAFRQLRSFREVSQLSGFCVLLKKESWESAGKFPEFFPFYGQESDLMDRLDKKILCKNVFVHHLAGGTIKHTPGRDQGKEKKLSLDVYKKVKAFDFKSQRLLVLGSGQGNKFPLWRGLDQGCSEIVRRGGRARHICLDDLHNQEMREKVEAFSPTAALVVCTNPTRLIESADSIRSLRCPVGLWHNDLRPVHTEYRALRKCFERLFLCWQSSRGEYDLDQWEREIGAPTQYMPQGSVINPYLRQPKISRRGIFIGNTDCGKYHTGRKKLFKDLGIDVINEPGKKRLMIEQQSPVLYRSAKFSFAMSPDVPGYNSLRMYNVLAYGGCLFVKRFDGVEKLVADGEDAIVFDSAEDARKKMNILDNDLFTRERVARSGWRLQQAKHTGLWRMLNMTHSLNTGDYSFWGEL